MLKRYCDRFPYASVTIRPALSPMSLMCAASKHAWKVKLPPQADYYWSMRADILEEHRLPVMKVQKGGLGDRSPDVSRENRAADVGY